MLLVSVSPAGIRACFNDCVSLNQHDGLVNLTLANAATCESKKDPRCNHSNIELASRQFRTKGQQEGCLEDLGFQRAKPLILLLTGNELRVST